MTNDEFELSILPFLDYIFDKSPYYSCLASGMREVPFILGNMVLVCSKSYVPDQLLILDKDQNFIDGIEICATDAVWNGRKISDIIKDFNYE